MDEAEVKRWFDGYLAEFAALGRGEQTDVRRILDYYGVPILLGTDAGCQVIAQESEVLAVARQQVEGMLAAGYQRSAELEAQTTILNTCTATLRGRFARLRADGSEIARLQATYLITDLPHGRRISALIVHSEP